MSNDLTETLRQLTDLIDRHAPTITIDEIQARHRSDPAQPLESAGAISLDEPDRSSHVRSHSAIVLTIAAAAMVIGLVVITTRPNRGTSDGDQNLPSGPATSIAIPTSPTETTSIGPTNSATSLVPSSVPAESTLNIDLGAVPEGPPTLLAPASLPDGLVFDAGGTAIATQAPTVNLWSADFSQWISLSWSGEGICATPGMTTPFGPMPLDVEAALQQHAERVAEGRSTDQFAQLRWCDVSWLLSIEAIEIPPDQLAAFARSVDVIDATHATVMLPEGFRHQVGRSTSSNSVLLYNGPHTSLRVLSFSATEGDFEVLRRNNPNEPFDIGGRQALWNHDTQLAIDYDDHTIAYVDGTGYDQQHLIDIAANLVPADPALAPPVSDNCDQFGGLCG
ncbi:MAG: hypothetical protein AAB131_20040 [Actinomycetota bacterium]